MDAAAGIEWEGEDPPQRTDADAHAIAAWNYLSNGMGGIDWSGLPVVCEYLGIEDMEGLMHRFAAIKAHEPPKEN